MMRNKYCAQQKSKQAFMPMPENAEFFVAVRSGMAVRCFPTWHRWYRRYLVANEIFTFFAFNAEQIRRIYEIEDQPLAR